MRALLVCCVLAIPTLAGKRVIMEGTQGPTKVRSELLLDGNRLRLNDGRGGSVLVTRNGQTFEVLSLDTTKRQYFAVDQSMMDGLAAALQDAQKRIDDIAEKMAPEQREQFKNLATVPEIRYEDAGDDRVDGVPCILFEQFLGEVKSFETCVAKPRDLGITEEEYRIAIEFGEYQMKMMEKLRNTSIGRTLDSLEMTLMMNPELRGIALRAGSVSPGAASFHERLVSVEAVAFTDADFSLGDAVRVDPPSMKSPSASRP